MEGCYIRCAVSFDLPGSSRVAIFVMSSPFEAVPRRWYPQGQSANLVG